MASLDDKKINGGMEKGTTGAESSSFSTEDQLKNVEDYSFPDVDHDEAEWIERGHQVDLQSQESHVSSAFYV